MAPRLRHVAKRSRSRNEQVSPPSRPSTPPTDRGRGAADGLVDVDRSGAPVIHVHAQPGAARAGIAGRHGDALKVRVSAPPVGGRANAAAAEVLAEALGVSRSSVELVSGAGSRQKRFRVSGGSPEAVTRALAEILER
jgi:uncharacterized protein